MKKIILSITCLVLMSAAAMAQTADEIVAKHITARGGADKMTAIKTMKMEAGMSAMGMDIPMKQYVVQGRAYKQEISVMGQDIIVCTNADGAWMINPMGGSSDPTDLPKEALEGITINADVSGGFLNAKENGTTFELQGTEKLDTKDVFKLKMTLKGGTSLTHYIDASTFLISKSIAVVMGTEAPVKFSNYKAVEGVMFPFSTETENAQAGTITMTVVKLEVNQPIDDSVFKKPSK